MELIASASSTVLILLVQQVSAEAHWLKPCATARRKFRIFSDTQSRGVVVRVGAVAASDALAASVVE